MRLLLGDLRDVLPTLEADSIDACVTDCPYELGFMGKTWDSSGVSFQPETWAHVLRVLKPGGHLLAFGGTRTYHRIAVAVEDAGFEIRDQIAWLFGSGFPKSLDVAKAIDKRLGTAGGYGGVRPGHEVVDRTDRHAAGGRSDGWERPWQADQEARERHHLAYEPGSEEARRWQGWGTALKPAYEPVVVARKPLEGTVAGNVLAHGVGAINVDACRIGYEDASDQSSAIPGGRATAKSGALAGGTENENERSEFVADNSRGRWPANVVLGHSPDCVAVGTRTVASDGHYPAARPGGVEVGAVGHAGQDGLEERSTRGETVEVWDCVPGVEVRLRWLLLSDGSLLNVRTAPWPVLREAAYLALASSRTEGTSDPRDGAREDAALVSGRADSPVDCRDESHSDGGPARSSQDDDREAARLLADALELDHDRGHSRRRSPESRDDDHPSSSDGPPLTERDADTRGSRTSAAPLLTSSSCPASTFRSARTGQEEKCDQSGSSAASSRDGLGEESLSSLHISCTSSVCRVRLGDLLEASAPSYVLVRTENVGACPVRLLDEQTGELRSGPGAVKRQTSDGWQGNAYGVESRPEGSQMIGYADAGGASRFFYCSKTSRAERNAGLDGFEQQAASVGNGEAAGRDPENPANFSGGKRERVERGEAPTLPRANVHPTVKPIDLMRWLLRLVVPSGGTVLDPFLGSGSTGCAAALEGLDLVGVELDPEYLRIAEARIAFWAEHGEDGLCIVAERAAGERARTERAATGQLDLLA